MLNLLIWGPQFENYSIDKYFRLEGLYLNIIVKIEPGTNSTQIGLISDCMCKTLQLYASGLFQSRSSCFGATNIQELNFSTFPPLHAPQHT